MTIDSIILLTIYLTVVHLLAFNGLMHCVIDMGD